MLIRTSFLLTCQTAIRRSRNCTKIVLRWTSTDTKPTEIYVHSASVSNALKKLRSFHGQSIETHDNLSLEDMNSALRRTWLNSYNFENILTYISKKKVKRKDLPNDVIESVNRHIVNYSDACIPRITAKLLHALIAMGFSTEDWHETQKQSILVACSKALEHIDSDKKESATILLTRILFGLSRLKYNVSDFDANLVSYIMKALEYVLPDSKATNDLPNILLSLGHLKFNWSTLCTSRSTINQALIDLIPQLELLQLERLLFAMKSIELTFDEMRQPLRNCIQQRLTFLIKGKTLAPSTAINYLETLSDMGYRWSVLPPHFSIQLERAFSESYHRGDSHVEQRLVSMKAKYSELSVEFASFLRKKFINSDYLVDIERLSTTLKFFVALDAKYANLDSLNQQVLVSHMLTVLQSYSSDEVNKDVCIQHFLELNPSIDSLPIEIRKLLDRYFTVKLSKENNLLVTLRNLQRINIKYGQLSQKLKTNLQQQLIDTLPTLQPEDIWFVMTCLNDLRFNLVHCDYLLRQVIESTLQQNSDALLSLPSRKIMRLQEIVKPIYSFSYETNIERENNS